MKRKSDLEEDWAIDSGSTIHITQNVEILENVVQTKKKNHFVIPNRELISIKGKGECTLQAGAVTKNVIHIVTFFHLVV